MECIGRSDFQVKINGFRIEIGEIQSRILNYPNIKRLLCISFRYKRY